MNNSHPPANLPRSNRLPVSVGPQYRMQGGLSEDSRNKCTSRGAVGVYRIERGVSRRWRAAPDRGALADTASMDAREPKGKQHGISLNGGPQGVCIRSSFPRLSNMRAIPHQRFTKDFGARKKLASKIIPDRDCLGKQNVL